MGVSQKLLLTTASTSVKGQLYLHLEKEISYAMASDREGGRFMSIPRRQESV